MKFTINVDCTPEEARAFFGLPDVSAVNEMIRLSKLIPDWSWKGTAIISRDWRKLLPVCDLIPAPAGSGGANRARQLSPAIPRRAC